jgi:hypothetical protein
MYAHMIEDHDIIRGIIAKLRALLIEDGMPIGHWFATTRWSLTRHLLRHLAVEGAIFRDQVRSHLDASKPTAPDTFEQRYREHIAHWTPDRIDAEWPRYCRELGAILNTLDRRMEFEEREVYPKLTERAAKLALAA